MRSSTSSAAGCKIHCTASSDRGSGARDHEGVKLRRHPHLRRTDPSETDPLDLLRSLPPSEAREAERLLQAQHRDQRRFESRETPELLDVLSNSVGRRMADAASTGGGRRRPTYRPSE